LRTLAPSREIRIFLSRRFTLFHFSQRSNAFDVAVKPDENQQCSDDKVQNVVRSRPAKIRFGKKMREAGDRLVNIDQTETEIESADVIFVADNEQNQTERAGGDVKIVISLGAARRRIFRRQDKAEQPDQNQDGRENEQNLVI
jgi:hypothetical protein